MNQSVEKKHDAVIRTNTSFTKTSTSCQGVTKTTYSKVTLTTNDSKVEHTSRPLERNDSEFLEERLSRYSKPEAYEIKTVAPLNRGEFGRDFLKAHNEYRKMHGAPPLSLSDTLSAEASKWADTIAKRDCMEHSPSSKYGENIYFCNGFTPTGSGVTQAWYNEVANYDFKSAQFSSGTGHFTAVVWAATKRIGFGVGHSTTGNFYVVANYEPAGNVMGAFKENVCPAQKSRSMLESKKESSRPKETPKGKSPLMDFFSRLFHKKPSFGEFQVYCLKAHNEFRAEHDSPAMKLDKKMCQEAQAWAEHLAAENLTTIDPNPRSYAQNVLHVSGKEADGVFAVRQWYSSMRQYRGRYSEDTASFMQVVWANSELLGVGVAKNRLGDTFVVAHYFPPGNILGEEEENVKKWKEAQRG